MLNYLEGKVGFFVLNNRIQEILILFLAHFLTGRNWLLTGTNNKPESSRNFYWLPWFHFMISPSMSVEGLRATPSFLPASAGSAFQIHIYQRHPYACNTQDHWAGGPTSGVMGEAGGQHFLYTERQQGWEFPQWGLLEDNLAREKAHFLLQMVGHKANSKLDAWAKEGETKPSSFLLHQRSIEQIFPACSGCSSLAHCVQGILGTQRNLVALYWILN